MALIQIDLDEKGDFIAKMMNDEGKKSDLADRLDQIQYKVSQNGKDISNIMEKSEIELIGIIKDIIKYRESQDAYGLQHESRKKAYQYLDLL